MKRVHLGFLFIFLFSCSSNEDYPTKEKNEILSDTIKEKIRNIVNFGLEGDTDLYVDYIGNYTTNGRSYSNIYGFTFRSIEDALTIDTNYYETEQRLENIDLSSFKFDLSPGDVTVKVTDAKGKTHIMFNVLENSELRHMNKGKSYDDLPTISVGRDNTFIGDNSISYSINQLKNDLYEITFKEFSRIFSIQYQLIGGELTKLSYLNRIDGYIYTIDKSIYLKPVKQISFIDYH